MRTSFHYDYEDIGVRLEAALPLEPLAPIKSFFTLQGMEEVSAPASDVLAGAFGVKPAQALRAAGNAASALGWPGKLAV